jgi:hypothetical protein
MRGSTVVRPGAKPDMGIFIAFGPMPDIPIPASIDPAAPASALRLVMRPDGDIPAPSRRVRRSWQAVLRRV